MYDQDSAVWVGGIAQQYNQAVFVTGKIYTRLQHIHTFHFGAVQPRGVFGIILLVLFTFNVTETEHHTAAFYYKALGKWRSCITLPLFLLSLSISSIISLSIYLSVLLLSGLKIHCLKFPYGTQTLPLYKPPLLSVSIFHRNSPKGGISKSTNGRNLIGKCYKGGGIVHCLQ